MIEILIYATESGHVYLARKQENTPLSVDRITQIVYRRVLRRLGRTLDTSLFCAEWV